MGVVYTFGGWVIVAAMAVRAVWLWFAWQGADALPMQWGLTGHPTWYASRGVALGLIAGHGGVHRGADYSSRRVSLRRCGCLRRRCCFLVIQTGYLYFARRYV